MPVPLKNAGCTAEPPSVSIKRKPKVLIAGGGLGGLMLAILLHKAEIHFEVFEKSHDIKPFGSAITLGAGMAALFQQLGLYEDFIRVAKPYCQTQVYTDDLQPSYTMNIEFLANICPHREYIIPRPDFFDLLWRHIPRENIHLGKKILSFDQDADGVTIKCEDGIDWHGDILVGADGAYSTIRERLFESLKAEGKHSTADDTTLPANCVCLVGQTKVLSVDEYPDLLSDQCAFYSVLGVETKSTWLTMTTASNSVCWIALCFLDTDTSESGGITDSPEWGTEATEALCDKVRDFKVPGGKDGKQLTLGDFIDQTPKECIARVMLEEKVFETWYHGRTVLLGDACHRLSPAGSVNTHNAIYDAVTLANWIATLQSPSLTDLDAIFKEYYDERYPVAVETFQRSQWFSTSVGKLFFNVCPNMSKEPAKVSLAVHCPKSYTLYEATGFLPAVD
ncbi:hypothetical protein BGZ94_002524 [Podila epigama]|nr:hypothetical protein BGZ94_002524 [Podila epigama]